MVKPRFKEEIYQDAAVREGIQCCRNATFLRGCFLDVTNSRQFLSEEVWRHPSVGKHSEQFMSLVVNRESSDHHASLWREPTRDRLADARLGRRGAEAPASSSVDQNQCVCRGGGRVILCERWVSLLLSFSLLHSLVACVACVRCGQARLAPLAPADGFW